MSLETDLSSVGGGVGTVTSIIAGTGLTGGTITSAGTIASTALYAGVATAAPTSASTGLSTWGNQSSAVVTDGETGLIISGATSTNNISIRYKAVPALPYTIDVLIERFSLDGNTNGALFGWYDGTKIEAVALYGNVQIQVYVLDYATLASGAGAANIRYTAASVVQNPLQWFRINDDNAGNITISSLPFGSTGPAITLYTVAKSSGYLGSSGYANVFFGVNRHVAYMAGILRSYKEH